MGKEEFFDEQIIDMMNKAEQKKESSKVNQSETVEERWCQDFWKMDIF